MKAIEWFWNLMFYNLYKWNVKASRVFNYINPFYWPNQTATYKERKAKYGISDWNKFTNVLMNNPKTGIGLYPVYASIGGLLVIFEFDLLFYILFLFKNSVVNVFESITVELIILGLMWLITVVVNKQILYKENKYLYYFKKFEELPPQRLLLYGWICFFVIIASFFFFFVTLNLQGVYVSPSRQI